VHSPQPEHYLDNVIDGDGGARPLRAWAVGYDHGSSGLNPDAPEHWDGSA